VNFKMTWGFVTCGPNEALVVSGKYISNVNIYNQVVII